MKITFISTIDAPSENLVLEKFPFVFGRGAAELQANSSDQIRSLLQHVSRKHATLTEEQGNLYLEDNGSLNGTSVNGKRLTSSKVLLATGDVILFADKLGYVVDLHEDPVSVNNAVVLLVPEENVSGESITINACPFALPAEVCGNDSSYLKIVFERNQAVLLSFTSQSEVMIDGKVVQAGRNFLYHDSIVQFAPGQSYRCVCDTGQLKSQASNHQSGGDDSVGESTVYMNEATTFMSVFSENQKEESDSSNVTPAKDGVSGAVKIDASSVASLPRTYWKQFLGVGCVVAVIFSALLFYRSTDVYKVQKYFDTKEYRKCLVLANDMLLTKNRDKIQSLAQKSFIFSSIPYYIGMLMEKDYAAIKTELAGYREIVTNVDHSEPAINALLFVARVDRFFSAEQKEHTISDNERKNEIFDINKEWLEAKNSYRPVLDEIVQQEPSFYSVVERFYAQLNDNRELEIYELEDIKHVEENIKSLLSEEKIAKVRDLINEFKVSHPNVRGEEEWLKDLERFELLVRANQEKNLFGLKQVIEQTAMQTELFREIAALYIEKSYPSITVQQNFNQARQFWQSGNPYKSINLLNGLPQSNWQEAIDRETGHMNSLITLVEKVKKVRTPKERCKMVAELYEMALEHDVFYKQMFADEHIRCRNQASITGKSYLRKANNTYKQYLQSGGITGKMRLDDVVSPEFRTQAQVLTKAYTFAVQGEKEMLLGNAELVDADKKRIEMIKEEYQLQHARLKGSTVLSKALIQQKLDMFKD